MNKQIEKENYKIKQQQQNYKIKQTPPETHIRGEKVKYDLRAASYKFKSTSYEFKSTSYDFKSLTLGDSKHELRD